MKTKTKYYVVWKGRKTGVFRTWDECKEQVENFQGALYRSFESESEAMQSFRQGASAYFSSTRKPAASSLRKSEIIPNSLAVDAACSGNPGDMEYRGVLVGNGREVFKMGPFPDGTNNVGEFLAIVHGLALLKQKNIEMTIYSDSQTAMGWVKKKHCNTKLERTRRNQPLFDLIERAENWLKNNTYSTPVLKWETKIWGEIPADFGRK